MEKKTSKKIQTQHPERMSVAEVADYFCITPTTVYRWLRAGKLPCKRTPTGYIAYISREAVLQFQVK